MKRFYIEEKNINNNRVFIKGSEYNHLVNVYRAEKGDEIELFDGKGNLYIGKIINIKKKEVSIEILKKEYSPDNFKIKVFLAQALLKSKQWDLLLPKMMELGLYGLYPIVTKYVANGKYTAGKRDRWEKILIESAKQCKRNSLIKIEEILNYHEFLERTKDFKYKLIAHIGNDLERLKKILEKMSLEDKNIEKILIVVGPEGGFTEKEIEEAQKYNFIPFSLGNFILKAETASISIVSNINFFFNI